jgi:serine/threonine-protein kinase
MEKLGRYDIIRVLGKGSMGVVYEARDPNLDRPVAIKTIRVQGLSAQASAEYESRFRTEARSAARLHHPNIVSVFDSGQDADQAYLVMEFIQGEDLKHHLECGARFSVRSAIAMVHDLLMALDHAHRQNVVHRDVKPANMLIEVTGRVKLTDFGVARIQEPDESHLTQVGGAVGTPKYMSPEQAKGQRGDSRSDVFSAGVVLYELLTGKLPFDGDNQFVIIHQIVSHEAVRPSTLNPDSPTSLDAVMARALAKNPQDRYPTARDFSLALREVAQQLPPAAATPISPVTADIGRSHAGPIQIAAADAALRDGSSTGIFGASASAALNSTVNHEAELGAWSGVQGTSDPQDLLDFLARFPAGIYAHRAQQALDRLRLRAQPDPDSTVGSFAATEPLVQPAAHRATRVGWARAGSVAVAVVAAVAAMVLLRPGTAPSAPAPVPVPEAAVEPAQVAALPVEEIIDTRPATAPSSSPPSVAHPAGTASAATLPGPVGVPQKPASSTVGLVKPRATANPPAPSVAPVPAPASAGAEPTAAPPSGPGRPAVRRFAGPSQQGQACADKTFIFRIVCVAEQCATDHYRDTPECIRFKEMERAREEQRARRMSQ